MNRVSVSSTHCFALHNNPGANCLKGKRLQFQTKSNNINNNNKTKKGGGDLLGDSGGKLTVSFDGRLNICFKK